MPLNFVGKISTRLVLVSLIGLLAVVLGFFIFSPTQALTVATFGAYWIILVAIALWGLMLWRIARDWWAGWKFTWQAGGCILLVLACGTLLQLHEPRGFKILMDEIMLLGSSMSLHLDKSPLVPIRGNDLQGAFQLLSGILDKRPLFFPVLLSMVHDVAGYRPANAWYLNGVLTYVFLGLSFLIGQRIAGRRGGVVAVLLLTSLPLLSQQATGGGFELLNLVMQAATLLLGIRYVERNDDVSLSAFCLATVLLAQTRYESVLFILPVAALVAWMWWRHREVRLPWPVMICPLLLVPYPLQHRVFDVRAESWELSSRPGYESVFSPAYIPENLGHALAFFFDFTRNAPNSPLLAVGGLLALPFFLLALVRKARDLRGAAPTDVVLVFFSAGFVALTGLLMCYFWGKFDDPVIRRLSLPQHLFMAIAVVALLAHVRAAPRVWTGMIVGIVAFLFAWSIPVMARHTYTLQHTSGREVAWRQEFIRRHLATDFMVIDNSSIIWLTHEVASTPMPYARARRDAISFLMRNRSFSAIYVFQRFDVDERTNQLMLKKEEDLGPEFTLETVEERRLGVLSLSRISKVVAVKAGPADPADARETEDFSKLTPAEREKIRAKYFETWLRNLP